jgi:asparagine synthase (glutamine-hydrolysing)
LPPENVNRRKMGFGVPVGRWFLGPLRDTLCDSLLSSNALGRLLFREREVRRLVDEHLRRRADHSFQLWTLLMVELWHHEFIRR